MFLCLFSFVHLPGAFPCPAADSFRCANGHCIDANLKCNGAVDCVDASDELGCSFRKTLPILLPYHLLSSSVHNKPLQVSLTLHPSHLSIKARPVHFKIPNPLELPAWRVKRFLIVTAVLIKSRELGRRRFYSHRPRPTDSFPHLSRESFRVLFFSEMANEMKKRGRVCFRDE